MATTPVGGGKPAAPALVRQAETTTSSTPVTTHKSAPQEVPGKGWAVSTLVQKVPFDDVNDVLNDGKLIGASGTFLSPLMPLSAIRGVLPDNGEKPKMKAVFVNGIMTDANLTMKNLQAVANTGLEVVGLHNATGGMAKDLAQCVGDKLNVSNNRATDAATHVISELLATGEPVVLIGHSQGALVLSAALENIERSMKERGKSPAEIEKLFSKLEIETLGGASWTFPKGPKLHHLANEFDLIGMLTGKGAAQEEGVVRFAKLGDLQELPSLRQFVLMVARMTDQTVHGVGEVYAEQLKKLNSSR